MQIAVIKTPRPANIAIIDSGGIGALFYIWRRIMSLRNYFTIYVKFIAQKGRLLTF